MSQFIVTVKKLNKRSAVPFNFPDTANIIGEVKEGFTFEGVEADITEVPNRALGKWYKDRDGHFYWGAGVNEVLDERSFVKEIGPPGEQIFDPVKMSWAFSFPQGLDIIGLWNKGLMGEQVRVAILDSGIDLSISDVTDSIKDKQLDLKSFVPGEDANDLYGHGTKCASVIASGGKKVFGSSPKCDLLIGKIYSKDVPINYDVLLKALKWACEERQTNIVSLSFCALYECNDANANESRNKVRDYINDAFENKNVLFVAAIGDSGSLVKDFCVFPANADKSISVGAFNQERKVWEGSSWNSKLTMVGPGVGLMGYDLSREIKILEAATSFACPFIAGIFANFISHYKLKGIDYSIKDLITKISYDAFAENDSIKNGNGIINTMQTFKNL